LRGEGISRLLTLTERVRDVILSIEGAVGRFDRLPGVGYKLTEAL
jgi:hypothetical protein